MYTELFSAIVPTLFMCRVELSTELFYATIPTLFLCFFADLLSLHRVTSRWVANISMYWTHTAKCVCKHFRSKILVRKIKKNIKNVMRCRNSSVINIVTSHHMSHYITLYIYIYTDDMTNKNCCKHQKHVSLYLRIRVHPSGRAKPDSLCHFW